MFLIIKKIYLSLYRTHVKLKQFLKDNGTIWVSGTYHNIFSIIMKWWSKSMKTNK